MEKFKKRCKCNVCIDSLSSFNYKGGDYFYCQRCNLYYDSSGVNVILPEGLYVEAKKIESATKKRMQEKILRCKYYENVTQLYYMTHKNNMESILNLGILSKNKVESEKIIYTDCSMKEVQDKREKLIHLNDGAYNIHETVPLYFTPKNPTYYKMQCNLPSEFCIIIVSKEIIHADVAFGFSDGNLGSSYSKDYSDLSVIDKLNWDIINSNEKWSDDYQKRKRCAEFLIYPKILPNYFVKILVDDCELKESVKQILIELNLNIPVEIDNNNKYFYKI
ncbi:MAG: DUF4433 domain-containing protein [Candidatus Aenigmarchaeota archaeon]|nr:DUF4433 domain-containing protein [Candidatus Aenigmarchaeota archaeon]MCK5630866.1 DUF4433 domain-containing protein [Nanoarchaeota archaeon]